MEFSLIHVYFGFLTFGLGYALIVFLMGNLGGDHDGSSADGGGDLDVGHGDVGVHTDGGHNMALDFHAEHDEISHDTADGDTHHGGLSPLSPLMLATLGTLFGGLGFVSLGVLKFIPVIPQSIADVVSIFVSLALAVILSSYFSYFLVKLFVGSETSTNVRSASLIGREGQTTLGFAAGKMGEISYYLGGSSQTNMAQLVEGVEQVKKGQRVEIVSMSDNILFVRPLENETIEEIDMT